MVAEDGSLVQYLTGMVKNANHPRWNGGIRVRYPATFRVLLGSVTLGKFSKTEMKIVFVCGLLMLCALSTRAAPWGSFNFNIQKNYDGPNLTDMISGLIRQKVEFKNRLWQSLMDIKNRSFSYTYNSNGHSSWPYKKTITINSNYGPGKGTSNGDCDKPDEQTTQPPIPEKKTAAPLVELEKTFEFNTSKGTGSGTSQYLPPGSGSSSNGAEASASSDSEFVDISELQRQNSV
ncbi:uncharacterized protein LOC131436059 [Malaya genurostris]|uniref:uncharacterized protein LOC131436059 n=1 Tax=Malaya genurostris TaxID=325434 RepID=UPI0026F3A163|nr:uncharacterized protein LOC131436059 [Malaya genurostris]